MKAVRHAPAMIAPAVILVFLACSPALAQYSYDWSFGQQGAVKDMLILEDFTTTFTNTSALTDSFRVTLAKEMPDFWQATICQGPVCFPPSTTVHVFTLAPGETTNLDFGITAAVDEGTGTSIVTVESLNDPGLVETNRFTIVTSGLEVLNVDADGGADYEPYFSAAITAAGRTHGTWTRSYMGALTTADLSSFSAVVWSVGTNDQGLTGADRTNLAEYVVDGGNLFLTGQNLVWDFCNPANPLYTPEARSWFREVLGVDYLIDDAANDLVDGIAGDPVGGGLALTINGGDGADNNSSPDAVVTLSNGAAALRYPTGLDAGVRGAFDKGRTFFAAFGFEGLSSAGQRADMMTSVLDWIITRVSAVDGDVRPPLVLQPTAVPNPFNPRTGIRFEVGGAGAMETEVVIYDLRGRVIRDLFRGVLEPGPRVMAWNGRDNGGRDLPSGIYLARVKVADQTRTVKMTLAR